MIIRSGKTHVDDGTYNVNYKMAEYSGDMVV
jgi:hypothetical protein